MKAEYRYVENKLNILIFINCLVEQFKKMYTVLYVELEKTLI